MTTVNVDSSKIEALVPRQAISLNRTGRNAMKRARLVKERRTDTAIALRAAVGRGQRPELPVVVTLTRIANSTGLDEHDNLPGSLKPFADGVCDYLGIRNDRDPRITWRYENERGITYSVRITIEPTV